MHASRTQPQACSPLLSRYLDVRRTTLEITSPFSAEDQMLQSMPDCSPAKWHLAHTTWFFETFILANLPGYRLFDPHYRELFNSYYKQLGAHPFRGSRGLMSRPSLEEIHAYRHWVDDALAANFERLSNEARQLVELGTHHEQQHQELILTDIKHALWSSPLRPERSSRLRGVGSSEGVQWLSFDKRIYEVGHAGKDFAFDNEGPRHEILLGEFQIASRQVSNAEYLEFMRDGGYRRPELWLSDGWDAVNSQHWNAPLYWEERDGGWVEFTFDGLSEVDAAAPVCHISYYEADAFARWSGARLPREEEWEVAASQAGMKNPGAFLDSGEFRPKPTRGPEPQWFGNVWEWTASAYLGYPGFVPAPGLVGEYNGKFMCNQFVLRGGSCATPASHIRNTYRNFFPPHARWQFMGLRLAR
jgi:ergothioneine biosynthesis protein EgtB